MQHIIKSLAGAAMTLALAAPAMAQSDMGDKVDWTGPYVGGALGYSWQPKDNDETIRFDTDGDGRFDNVVTTAAGANAFSPGFCGGAAHSNVPATGCRDDKDGTTWSVHAGYDKQFGNIVAGLVVEGGKTAIRNSVSGYSTTPASYTMTRSLDWNAGVRARLGYTTNSGTLIYATGGGAYGKVKNRFSTTNTFNTFTQTNSKDDAWGWTAGGGIEQKVSKNFSVGVLYKYTRLDSDGYTVNAGQGTPASTTNPFVITPAGSTDFNRYSTFDNHSVMATASFRF
ncbi:outer membrane beta-barrel protein [soil metagenome]